MRLLGAVVLCFGVACRGFGDDGSAASGHGGAAASGSDVVPQPPCVGDKNNGIVTGLTHIADLSLFDRYDGQGLTLYAVDDQQGVAAFLPGQDDQTRVASNWMCFEGILHACRIANAKAPKESIPDAYAITSDRTLVFREVYDNLGFWSPWTPLSLPEPGRVLDDVAATGVSTKAGMVMVVSEGQPFYRTRTKSSDASLFSAWTALPTIQARRITAAKAPNRDAEAFVADEVGAVYEFDFADEAHGWSKLDAPFKVVDLHAIATDEAAAVLYVLGPGGSAARFSAGEWSSVISSTPNLNLVSLSAGFRAGWVDTLAAADDAGQVWMLVPPRTAWSAIDVP